MHGLGRRGLEHRQMWGVVALPVVCAGMTVTSPEPTHIGRRSNEELHMEKHVPFITCRRQLRCCAVTMAERRKASSKPFLLRRNLYGRATHAWARNPSRFPVWTYFLGPISSRGITLSYGERSFLKTRKPQVIAVNMYCTMLSEEPASPTF